MNLLNHAVGGPAFQAYSLTCVLLCLNLLLLWAASGAVRAKGGLAVNPEVVDDNYLDRALATLALLAGDVWFTFHVT